MHKHVFNWLMLGYKKRVSTTTSDAPSQVNLGQAGTGLELIRVLTHVWKHKVTLKSDFARNNVMWIAAACSLGWVTNMPSSGVIDHQWFITNRGLDVLYAHDGGGSQ